VRSRFFAAVFFLLSPPWFLPAQQEADRTIKVPLGEWLATGEHKDFKAELRISEPFLTYQQRHRLRVFSSVEMRPLQKHAVKRHLHYILKVADESGTWFPGESYMHQRYDEVIKTRSELEIVSEIHLRPGRYRLAAIIYDSETQQRNVRFAKVHVKPVDDDPLPGIDQMLPRVEFLPGFDRSVVAFGGGKLNLPVANPEPVQIDIVFDVGMHLLHGNARLASLLASRQVQAANVLSDLRLQSGCISLTAVDVLRQELLFLRADAAQIDWVTTRQEILNRNLHTIEAGKLDARNQVGQFFRQTMEDILATAPGCSGTAAKGRRMIIVLTSGVLFPPRSRIERVQAPPACRCSTIYLKLGQISIFDDVPKALKDLDLERIEADDPRKFRKRLRDLMIRIEQLSASR
jgi:hypothetical protein